MLGSLNYKYGLFEDAKIYYEKSLVLYEQMQDKSTAAHLYIDLGNLELNLNNLDQARKRFDDALSKFDIKEDPSLILSLGNLEKKAGQNDKAKLQYKKALDLFEKIPNHIGQAFVLRQLAELNKSDGKYDEARSNYRESAIKYGLASMSLEQKSMINLSNQFWFQEWIIWIFLLLALIFLLLFLKFKKMNSVRKNEDTFQNKEINLGRKWVKYSSDKEVTVIFIHGIFSGPDAFKNAETNQSWADLLHIDDRFKKPNIFHGQFYTAFDSGNFDISNAADEIEVQLNSPSSDGLPSPISSNNIVFIAHSTGGLVIRDLLTSRPQLFKDKKIGLVLVASPSNGSEWANRLKIFIDITNNRMADQLREGNDFVRG